MDHDKWIGAGERMGLTGSELQEYVEKREKEFLDREERMLRREDEKSRLEFERLKLEEERLEKQASLKREEQEREMELLKLRAATEVSKSEVGSKSLRPKLPKFEEQKDDMDAYIERFERFARSQGWREDTWAVSLSSLLTGKGLEVYTSMPPEQADDYPALKKAVLKRYQLTEEGFRLKFRDSKPEQGETVFQFMARLVRYFSRWAETAEVDGTFESLVDLIIREQFIQTCSPELALFLKERMLKSRAEVTKYAEQYIEAHGGSIASRRPNKLSNGAYNKQPQRPVASSASKPLQAHRPSGQKPVCFICRKEGHFARDCKKNDQKKISGAAVVYEDSSNKSSSRGWRQNNTRSRDQSPDRHKVSAVCMSLTVEPSPAVQECIQDGELQLANGQSVPIIAGGCTIDSLDGERNLNLQTGFVGDTEVRVLRDTGCELAAVRKNLVSEDQMLDKRFVMITIDGQAKIVPAALIEIDTPYYRGSLEAMVLTSLICDLVLGNIDGVSDTPDQRWSRHEGSEPLPERVVAAVVTRAQAVKAKKPLKALSVPSSQFETLDIDSLQKAQRKDTSLKKLWSYAQEASEMKTKGGSKYRYVIQKGVLYREFEQVRGQTSNIMKQVVVPSEHRKRVMSLAHESIVGGHLAAKKTIDRITTSFHWPGITSDVTRFCRSCEICQKTLPKGKVTKVPLGEMPIMDVPFHRVAVDLIGPITPVSENGNRYILTIVDFATKYPEAVALPRIETERVAEALLDVFSRVGFPTEILSDKGSQFTSDLMKEVCRLISLKQLFTTPYNPKCNGLCERMNGVLKSMLKKMCQEKPKDWDRYLSAVLFAYREVPQASTGFAPFELLYGRTVRGPMQVLKELWTEKETPEVSNTYQYVLELRNRLEETCKIARDSLYDAQSVYKHHYDKSTRQRGSRRETRFSYFYLHPITSLCYSGKVHTKLLR